MTNIYAIPTTNVADQVVEANLQKQAELAIKLIFEYDSIGELSAIDIDLQVLAIPAVIDYLDFNRRTGYVGRRNLVDKAIAKEIKRYVIKH